MARAKKSKQATNGAYLRCVSGFMARGVVVATGQIVAASDPIVTGRETLFVDAGDGVEQATRAPGEVRIDVTRRAAPVVKADGPTVDDDYEDESTDGDVDEVADDDR